MFAMKSLIDESYQTIEREVEILRQLDHPNLVKLCFVLKKEHKITAMVLEYIDGFCLVDWLAEFPESCTEPDMLFILFQVQLGTSPKLKSHHVRSRSVWEHCIL